MRESLIWRRDFGIDQLLWEPIHHPYLQNLQERINRGEIERPARLIGFTPSDGSPVWFGSADSFDIKGTLLLLFIFNKKCREYCYLI